MPRAVIDRAAPLSMPQGNMALLVAVAGEAAPILAPQLPSGPAVDIGGLGLTLRIPGMGCGSGIHGPSLSADVETPSAPFEASPACSVTPVDNKNFNDPEDEDEGSKKEPVPLPAKPNFPASMMTGLSRADLDKFREEIKLNKKDSIYSIESLRPPNLKGTKKPPPHFLAITNWDEAAYYVRYFAQTLSKEQQENEWKSYQRLSKWKQGQLLGVIKNMHENCTTEFNATLHQPSQRVQTRQANDSLQELIVSSLARSHEPRNRQTAAWIQSQPSQVDRKKKQPASMQVEATTHIGLASSQQARDDLVESRAQQKHKRRKNGEAARAVGKQWDSKAIHSMHRLLRAAGETFTACNCPDRKDNDASNRFALVQLNDNHESNKNGGTFLSSKKSIPKLTIVALTKEDAEDVFDSVAMMHSPDAEELSKVEVEWIIGGKDVTLKQSIEEVISRDVKARGRPSRKS